MHGLANNEALAAMAELTLQVYKQLNALQNSTSLFTFDYQPTVYILTCMEHKDASAY